MQGCPKLVADAENSQIFLITGRPSRTLLAMNKIMLSGCWAIIVLRVRLLGSQRSFLIFQKCFRTRNVIHRSLCSEFHACVVALRFERRSNETKILHIYVVHALNQVNHQRTIVHQL